MFTMMMVVIAFVPVTAVDNCTINGQGIGVLEKLVTMARKLSTCSRVTQDITVTEPIAFYATATKGVTVSGSQTMIYDKVYTNYGSAYDVRHGIFRAPITGLYFFTATLLPGSSNGLHNILVKNNHLKLSKLYGVNSMGATSAVIKLEKGETMGVQHHPGANSQIINFDEYCTFAGYLITALK